MLMVPVKSEEGGNPIFRKLTSPVISARGDNTAQGGMKAAGGRCGLTVACAAGARRDQRPMAPSDGGRGKRSRWEEPAVRGGPPRG